MARGKSKHFTWLDADNGGVAPAELVRYPVTPESHLFVRTHTPTANLDRQTLIVDGLVKHALRLTLDDLFGYPSLTLPAALACAGNRRVEMDAQHAISTAELRWDSSAVGSAEWKGVPLAVLLDQAGVKAQTHHIALLGADGFGASIPLEKALTPEILVAYAMNDRPLPETHGAPFRLIVPGYIGARSVKWLARITAQTTPSDNHYQQIAYRMYPPTYTTDEQIAADRERGVMIGELPVNSAIASPATGTRIAIGKRGRGYVRLRGWALSGGAEIVRVAVSVNDGQWIDASLSPSQGPWAWRLWSKAFYLAPGTHTLRVCAWDAAGRAQPRTLDDHWNYKGYLNHAQPVVTVTVE